MGMRNNREWIYQNFTEHVNFILSILLQILNMFLSLSHFGNKAFTVSFPMWTRNVGAEGGPRNLHFLNYWNIMYIPLFLQAPEYLYS
jgi:hypothetical protein